MDECGGAHPIGEDTGVDGYVEDPAVGIEDVAAEVDRVSDTVAVDQTEGVDREEWVDGCAVDEFASPVDVGGVNDLRSVRVGRDDLPRAEATQSSFGREN